MNKPLITLITIFFTFNLFSQTISNKNWTLIHERTATWCPFCGTWGWTAKDSILNRFENKNTIFMAVHHSGDLTNPTAQAFGNNFSGNGQPIFYVDGININMSGSNLSQKLAETQLEKDFKDGAPPFAGVGIDAFLDKNTNKLSVKANVEFLQAVEGGDYYFGLYLLEDVQNIQASRSGVQTHKNVLRASFFPEVFGKSFKKGNVNLGEKFQFEANLENITAARDKVKVVGIIWNLANNKFLFFNANQTGVGIPASNNDIEKEVKFKAFQTRENEIQLEWSNLSKYNSGTLKITDISGKQIYQNSIELTQSGNQKIQVNITSGVHIINLLVGAENISKKILIH